MAEVLSVSPVLVELARKQVEELESVGKTPPVALRRIAEARPVRTRPLNGVTRTPGTTV